MSKSEIAKQAGDQSLHALWGFSTGFISFVAHWGLGWPGALVGGLFAAGSIARWIAREVGQWTDPEHPGAHLLWPGAPGWLDPALDSVVFAVATGGGIATGILVF